ncbi:glucose-1-phosphate thymidylyltransferase RfbA [Flavonifractor sp. An306]|uniref:glucose-1-phosphate thymidylyltransferase RfbA n=1 Tax=Flavonifractor sp. An306 TaxID=1965629 RepID=UPI000B3AC4CB|nr:glucose-1-phosphate thymidylyltransferase RfbA [Flavonifractor sp. An306]OUO38226.1 glucose-1-phosphate thymidylyltransferase [Flavonifractor sp. An306]
MKGIVLAGGRGTRLYPMTLATSKQILPLYDKPMVYYPISVLMLGGIRDILLITTPEDIAIYKRLLGDGSHLGIKISYCIQERPAGLAHAFILGESFIGNSQVCLVLGDNIFYGSNLTLMLQNAIARKTGATIFGYPVKNPKDFGVVEFSDDGMVLSIEEKPTRPKSNYAVPGLYFYDSKVVEIAKQIKPSARGELEITAVNNAYLKEGKLHVELMGRGMAWLDTGTPQGMLKAAQFIEAIQNRQGMYIACLEEIAWRRGFISLEALKRLGSKLKMTEYGQYILSVAEESTMYHR